MGHIKLVVMIKPLANFVLQSWKSWSFIFVKIIMIVMTNKHSFVLAKTGKQRSADSCVCVFQSSIHQLSFYLFPKLTRQKRWTSVHKINNKEQASLGKYHHRFYSWLHQATWIHLGDDPQYDGTPLDKGVVKLAAVPFF